MLTLCGLYALWRLIASSARPHAHFAQPPPPPLTPCCVLGTDSCASCAAPSPVPLWRLLASLARPHAHSARPLCILRGHCAVSRVLSAFASSPMCPQRNPLRPQCNITSNFCLSPHGVEVINSTIVTHRPVDYSSPCELLYSPVDSVHAVWCRQSFSRRPLPLPCRLLLLITPPQLGAQDEESHTPRHQGRSLRWRVYRRRPSLFVSFTTSHPGIWASQHIWEDVSLDRHSQLHLHLSSLHGDSAIDLVGHPATLCRLSLHPLGIRRYRTSSYYPQTNGMVERSSTADVHPHGLHPTRELVPGELLATTGKPPFSSLV